MTGTVRETVGSPALAATSDASLGQQSSARDPVTRHPPEAYLGSMLAIITMFCDKQQIRQSRSILSSIFAEFTFLRLSNIFWTTLAGPVVLYCQGDGGTIPVTILQKSVWSWDGKAGPNWRIGDRAIEGYEKYASADSKPVKIRSQGFTGGPN